MYEMRKNYHATDFEDVKFIGSRIDRAELAFVSAFKCDFEKANLIGAKGVGSAFTECYFGGAQLVDADFEASRFSDCDLVNVNFFRADLKYASFYRTNLTSADFTAADLRFADFSGARGLTLEQVQKATNFDGATLPKSVAHK
jgi:uncharacterized protein YjbI with pentapeptide repeats